MKEQLKWWWQRRTRGFDDQELWDLSTSLSKYILPRLKAFREMERWGVPGSICTKHHATGGNAKEWNKIIDKMIWSFEEVIDEKRFPKKMNPESIKKYIDRKQEGLDLFAKYFESLWD